MVRPISQAWNVAYGLRFGDGRSEALGRESRWEELSSARLGAGCSRVRGVALCRNLPSDWPGHLWNVVVCSTQVNAAPRAGLCAGRSEMKRILCC